MKLVELHINNFLAIGKAQLDLADRGLMLIQGINNDDTSTESNGAGKSSIADAICWCLFGTTARGVSGDGVVNHKAGKDCMVQAVLHDDGTDYVITRYRKSKKEKNALYLARNDGTSVTDLTQGTEKLTQEKILQVLGSTYEVFRAAVYLGQEQMPDLPAMTDKQLKLLVEEAAGVTVIEAAYKEAGIRLAKVREEHDRVAGRIEREQDLLVSLEEMHERLAEASRTWALRRDEDVRTQTLAAREEKARLDALAAEIAAAGASEITAKIAGYDAKIAAVRTEQDRLAHHEAVLAETAREVSMQQFLIRQTEDAIAKKREDLANIEKRIGTTCGECGKLYCEHDMAGAREMQMSQIAALEATLPDLHAALDSAVSAHESALSARDTFRASMTDVSAVSAERAALATQLAEIQRRRDAHAAGLEALRGSVERIKTLRDAADPYAAQIRDSEEKILAQRFGIAKLESRLKIQAAEVEIAQTVVKVFSPAGVRARILDEVTPFLNDQTAKYLSVMSDGNITATWTTLVRTAKGELREKFSIEVENAHGGKTFAAISGGEKRKVRIAAALALQDLVARRATKPFDLFIGDEMDDALDVPGLERLMMVLEDKAAERGTVLIISHNDLKDWVSQQITVTKVGDVSRVEEVVA